MDRTIIPCIISSDGPLHCHPSTTRCTSLSTPFPYISQLHHCHPRRANPSAPIVHQLSIAHGPTQSPGRISLPHFYLHRAAFIPSPISLPSFTWDRTSISIAGPYHLHGPVLSYPHLHLHQHGGGSTISDGKVRGQGEDNKHDGDDPHQDGADNIFHGSLSHSG